MNAPRWAARAAALMLALLPLGAVALADDVAAADADRYAGFTRPSLEVTVGSRVEGLVAEVLVAEGARVSKGDILLRLDATIERIEVELSRLRAEAGRQVEAGELIARQKEAELARGRTLLERGSITGTEVEQMELEVKIARMNVEVARSQQQAAQLQLQRDLARLAQRDIRAPADGIVTRIHKDAGESVERLETVAELVQLDPLEVVLNLPAATRGRYAAGQPARVLSDDQAAAHAATVTMVDPVIDYASGTYRVKLSVPNGDGKLQAGVPVTVDLGGK